MNDLWEISVAGRETISTFDTEWLRSIGANQERIGHQRFVAAEGVLDGTDEFDAGFFGYSGADASAMDPQQRIFLECAYQALEDAGCDPARTTARVGVFAGAGTPLHWFGLAADTEAGAASCFGDGPADLRTRTLNAGDFLTTRVAFKLGLRGPAVTVQTACSTSLVAVHLARQSLLTGDCDLVLAGGVSITSLRAADLGYAHDPNAQYAADGHCRPFDATSSGMVPASGVALVVLKRLADARRDGDHVHAVLLGSAMGNDGAAKIGFTAPSESGIADVVARAYATAGIAPATIGYIEAHGTGTRLGDPIEVKALTAGLRRNTATDQLAPGSVAPGSVALGSVKANIGHTDAAAGVIGLIKAALVVERGTIPPVAGFTAANPYLNLPNTPFYVPDRARPWPDTLGPRRASVNATGIGGTDVHVLLEQAPDTPRAPSERAHHLVCLSARSADALADSVRLLTERVRAEPGLDPADVAATLGGRPQHRHRVAAVCSTTAEIGAALAAATAREARRARPVAFLFPGHGTTYPRLGIEVYEAEPVFRAELDRCFELVRAEPDLDLRGYWLGETLPESTVEEFVHAQLMLFAVEYALATQLRHWGLRPVALLGHSVGEYVAGCLAGVFGLSDAMALVLARGRLHATTPPGAMVIAHAELDALRPHLGAGVTVATHAPGATVLTGLRADIELVTEELGRARIETTPVRVDRAAHSPIMDPILDALRERFTRVALRPPTIPVIANRTGAPMTAEQATDPSFWADHVRSPVQLTDGLGQLLGADGLVTVEVGAGSSLTAFLSRHPAHAESTVDSVTTLPAARHADRSAHESLLRGVGHAWALGVEIDQSSLHRPETRRKVDLPGYPFQRRSYAPTTAPGRVAPSDLATRLVRLAERIGVRDVDDEPGLRLRLEELCAALVLDFFADCLPGGLTAPVPADSLWERTGLLADYAPMGAWLVDLLEQSGLLRRSADDALLFAADMAGRSATLAAQLSADIPAATGLVRFAVHSVGRFDAIMSGRDPAVSVLYPDGDNTFHTECVNHLGPPPWHAHAALARELALEAVTRRGAAPARILEVGAGFGVLTWPLADLLRGQDVEYHFSDVGPTFLRRAKAEAASRGLDFVRTRSFDLDRAPAEQGLHDRFDLILGLDSVHCARDLPAALANLRTMLAPGGALVFVEITREETWTRLTVGLLPEYWKVRRRRDFVLDGPRWERLLLGAGFTTARAVPRGPAGVGELADGYCLLVARTADDLPPAPVIPPAMPVEMTSQDTTAVIGELWRRLLGVSRSASDDESDFFALGGDSLLAVQLLAEVRLRTGQHVPVRQFVERPTIRGLTELLAATPPPAEPVRPAVSSSIKAALDPTDSSFAHVAVVTSDETAIQALLDEFVRCTNNRDAVGLCGLYTADTVLISPSESVITGMAQLRRHYDRKMASLAGIHTRQHEWTIRVLPGEQVGYAMGVLDSDQVFTDGRRISYRDARLSVVAVREGTAGATWRITHSHYSLPVGGKLDTLDE